MKHLKNLSLIYLLLFIITYCLILFIYGVENTVEERYNAVGFYLIACLGASMGYLIYAIESHNKKI